MPPPPVTELTLEQKFKLKRMKDLLPKARKEDLETLIDSLQHQNFCLANTISNLLKEWPTKPTDLPITEGVISKFGISSATKDSPTT
jgi:hypothetical protein